MNQINGLIYFNDHACNFVLPSLNSNSDLTIRPKKNLHILVISEKNHKIEKIEILKQQQSKYYQRKKILENFIAEKDQ